MSDEGSATPENNNSTTVLASQSAITFGGTIAQNVLGFAFIVIATRTVDQSTFGVYVLTISIVTILSTIGDLGIYHSIDYFVPKHLSEGSREAASNVVLTAATVGFVCTIIMAVFILLSSGLLASIFNEPTLQRALLLAAVFPVLNFCGQLTIRVFTSSKRLIYRAVTKNILFPVVRLLGFLILLPLVSSIDAIVTGHLIGVTMMAVVGIGIVSTKIEWFSLQRRRPKHVKRLTRYAIPLALASTLNTVIGQIDYFFIGYFLSSADVGIYRTAYLLASNLLLVIASIAPVFKPVVAGEDDQENISREYKRVTKWAVLATVPLFIALVSDPTAYLITLFSSQYVIGSMSLVILCIGYLVNAAVGPEKAFLEGRGFTRLVMLNTLIFLALNGVLNIIFIPKIGIAGAAIGTSTSLSFTVLLGALEIYYIDGASPVSINAIKALLIMLPTVLFGRTVAGYLSKPLYSVIILPLVILVIYVLALVLLNAFDEEDLSVAYNIDERLGVQILTPIVKKGQ